MKITSISIDLETIADLETPNLEEVLIAEFKKFYEDGVALNITWGGSILKTLKKDN